MSSGMRWRVALYSAYWAWRKVSAETSNTTATRSGSSSSTIPVDRLTPVSMEIARSGFSAETGELSLAQNRPNPFGGSTTIEFALPNASHVNLAVYDVTGRRVLTLVDETRSAGTHRVDVQGHSLTPGVYFYRLVTEEGTAQRKMIVLE